MLPLTILRHCKSALNPVCSGKSWYLNQCFRSHINWRQYHSVKKTYNSPLLSAQNSVLCLKTVYKSLIRRVGTESVSHPKKIVGYWLLGCSGMVITAVILGGTTRLTESGLSMVTWRLLGEKIPRTINDWELELKKYKEYPEYKLLKRDITLSEFKWIWWMEFAHRSWGRLIGAAFYIPAAFFWFKGYLTPAYQRRVVLFGMLIAFQGLMGWYMVKSGLEDRFHGESDIPRVSQYRLAAHLGLALMLYTATLNSAFDILFPLPKVATSKNIYKLRKMTHIVKGLIFVTAISGAFVAGLDAGLVYNSFPKMGDKWIPAEILSLSPIFKNFTENPVTVQFNHRILGTATMLSTLQLWFLSQNMSLPYRTHRAFKILAKVSLLQVALGIATLLHFVPIPLAVIHQSGSLALLSCVIWLTHDLKFIKYIPK